MIQVIVDVEGIRRRVALSDGDHVIGRSDDCAVVIKDSSVSRHHARLAVHDGHMELSDLGSANGTFRNGERVTTTTLAPGDDVRLGSVRIAVEGVDAAAVQPTEATITQMLNDLAHGDEQAADVLLPLIYDSLRKLARSYLRREGRDHTLQPTALVHEAYLRLLELEEIEWQWRAHFFGVASQMMRRVLVDHGRRRRAAKRGSGYKPVPLEEGLVSSENRLDDAVIVDQLLERLEALNPQQHRIVELRFFGGLTIEEIADVMNISPSTVKRDWNEAKAWLHHELSRGSEETDSRSGPHQAPGTGA